MDRFDEQAMKIVKSATVVFDAHEIYDVLCIDFATALRDLDREAEARGIERAAGVAKELSCGFHSPWEYKDDVVERIRALLGEGAP